MSTQTITTYNQALIDSKEADAYKKGFIDARLNVKGTK